MADNKNTKPEPDSIYVLKLVFFLLLGSQWLRIALDSGTEIPIPVGALLGLILVSHEKFQIDKKVEYVVLLLSMFIGFWLPMGFELSW